MAEPTTFRARYVEVELINEGEALVLLRTADGEDITMAAEPFRSLYVPIHSTTVDLAEITS